MDERVTPSDDELNRAAAEACGWTNIHEKAYTPSGKQSCATSPGATDDRWGYGRTYIPRFCTDRNALPELIAEVGKTQARINRYFAESIRIMQRENGKGQVAWWWENALPRFKVEAALKALEVWRTEWKEE